MAYVYMLRCADGSYYVGSTRTTLEARMAQHDSGALGGYTARHRPVTLVLAQEFQQITDAIAAERKLKGWSRAKKEALIRADYEALRLLARGPRASDRADASSALRPSTRRAARAGSG
jgi:putative endonuclease